MDLGTWPLLLLFQGLGKHSPAESQREGRSRLQNSQPPALLPPAPHTIWALNLSLVPEAQGQFSLIPELPLAPQEVAVTLTEENTTKGPFRSLQFSQVV